jgi:hypothetical protein
MPLRFGRAAVLSRPSLLHLHALHLSPPPPPPPPPTRRERGVPVCGAPVRRGGGHRAGRRPAHGGGDPPLLHRAGQPVGAEGEGAQRWRGWPREAHAPRPSRAWWLCRACTRRPFLAPPRCTSPLTPPPGVVPQREAAHRPLHEHLAQRRARRGPEGACGGGRVCGLPTAPCTQPSTSPGTHRLLTRLALALPHPPTPTQVLVDMSTPPSVLDEVRAAVERVHREHPKEFTSACAVNLSAAVEPMKMTLVVRKGLWGGGGTCGAWRPLHRVTSPAPPGSGVCRRAPCSSQQRTHAACLCARSPRPPGMVGVQPLWRRRRPHGARAHKDLRSRVGDAHAAGRQVGWGGGGGGVRAGGRMQGR